MAKAMRDREEALRKSHAEMEQRIRERTAELARANDCLKTEIAERKQAEELYKALAENSLSAVFIVQDKKFRYINTSAIAYAGYNAEESIGADSYTIVHPDDRKMVKNKAREVMRNRSTTPYEYRMVTKQGQIRWIMQIISPILYKGRPAILGNAIDVTEHKLAEEALQLSEEKYRTLVENINDVLFSLDTRGIFTYISPAIEQFSQYKPDEVIGQPFARFIHPYDLPGLQESFKERLRGESGSFEFRVFAKDGSMRYVRTSSNPVWEDGQLTGVTGLMTDITERKQMEEALRKANAELESFSYSVSHDLRAPLRGIDGWSLALLEDYAEKFDDKGRKYIELMRTETQRMGRLIDCLLELSRVTRTDMRREWVDLSALAHSISARLKDAEPERRVEFVIQPGLMAHGDVRLLDVMMTNLFDNAWKFTGKHPSARIEFGRIETNGQLTFFIRDDGVGFDMAYARKLFGAFQRMHRESEFPGSGVGLATVQRIVHRHGGQVWAEAKVEKGTTIYFVL